MLEDFGEITVTNGQISRATRKVEKKKRHIEQLSLVSFFNKLGLHLMDTYLVVAMAAMEICTGGYEIR